jgi:hypothetical protein
MTQRQASEQDDPLAPNKKDIRQDPLIAKLLGRLPAQLVQSYTDEQLEGIKGALGPNTWGCHFIDNRGTFKFPFIKWRFYLILVLPSLSPLRTPSKTACETECSNLAYCQHV